jgi:hypothetical protein
MHTSGVNNHEELLTIKNEILKQKEINEKLS